MNYREAWRDATSDRHEKWFEYYEDLLDNPGKVPSSEVLATEKILGQLLEIANKAYDEWEAAA